MIPTGPTSARFREHIVVFAACFLLSVLFTLPWHPNRSTAPTVFSGEMEFAPRVDVPTLAYAMTWSSRHLDRYFSPPVMAPLPTPLAAIDPRLYEGILTVPLFRWLDPMVAWGWVVRIGLAVTAFSAYWAGRSLTRSGWGGAAVAIVYGFGAWRAKHVYNVELIFSPFLPLLFSTMARFLRVPARAQAVGLVLALAGTVTENAYDAVAVTLILPVIFAIGCWRRQLGLGRYLTPLALGGALVLVILLPVLPTYYAFHKATGLERTLEHVDHTGSYPVSWITGMTGRLLNLFEADTPPMPEARLFPGLIAVTLGLAGLRRLGRRSPEIALAGLFALLLSFGTLRLWAWRMGWTVADKTPYEILHALFLPLRIIRSPTRFSLIVHLVLGFSAAFAVTRIAQGRGRLVAVGLLLLSFLEARAGMHEVSVRPEHADDPAYTWLATKSGDFAVVDVPMGRSSTKDGDNMEAMSLYPALVHGHATVNGTVVTPNPWHESIAMHLLRPRRGETEEILRALGIRFVVARTPEAIEDYVACGLPQVFRSPGGFTVFEVNNPAPVPRTPAEAQERLMHHTHTTSRERSNDFIGTIIPENALSVRAGRFYHFAARVANTGPDTWCMNGAIFGWGPVGDVSAGIACWRRDGEKDRVETDQRGRVLQGFGPLPWDLAPGESGPVTVTGYAPTTPGRYQARFAIVVHRRRWILADEEVMIEVTP